MVGHGYFYIIEVGENSLCLCSLNFIICIEKLLFKPLFPHATAKRANH